MQIKKVAQTLIRIAIEITVLILIAVLVIIFYFGDDGEEKIGVPVDPPVNSESSFVVFGDAGIGYPSIFNKLLYPEKLSALIEQVNAIEAPMAIVVGDMFAWGDVNNENDSKENAEEFLEIMANLNAEWYPVMGNHDAEGLTWAVTKDLIFDNQSTYYSFDSGDSHFIILDAYTPSAWASIPETQMAWLDYDLRTTAKPHIFVFLHCPLYPTGPHFGESLDTDVEVRDRLVAFLLAHDVDAVFCGHEHYYCSLEYQGLMQVTTGGAGTQPLGKYPDMDQLTEEYGYSVDQITRYIAVRSFHYVVVQVHGYDVEIKAYDLDGLLIDQFSLTSERTSITSSS